MNKWKKRLRYDPLPRLLSAGDEALIYFVRRDLLGGKVSSAKSLWELPGAQRILRRQQADGSWRQPGGSREKYPYINHNLYETFKQLKELVGKYEFDRRHAAIERAAEYVFSCQTAESDLRGILGNQYVPYYNGVIAEQLISAGYRNDPRLLKILSWLLAMRQDEGGWILPVQENPERWKHPENWRRQSQQPNRSLPFSHFATGMVLRAFAVHPRYRRRKAVREAGALLKSRIFQPDRYGARKAAHYWTKFQYPFFWPSLLTALDTLVSLGFTKDDEDVQRGLAWFVEHQQQDGLWPMRYEQTKGGFDKLRPREQQAQLWVALAVCRVFAAYEQ